MSYVGRWQEYQISGWKGKGKRREVRGDSKGEEGRRNGRRWGERKVKGGRGEKKAP